MSFDGARTEKNSFFIEIPQKNVKGKLQSSTRAIRVSRAPVSRNRHNSWGWGGAGEIGQPLALSSLARTKKAYLQTTENSILLAVDT